MHSNNFVNFPILGGSKPTSQITPFEDVDNGIPDAKLHYDSQLH